MRRFLIGVALLLAATLEGYGQARITGVLLVDGKPYEGVCLHLSPPDNRAAVLGFAYTDEKGRFAIAVRSSLPELLLSARGVGIADTVIRIPNRTQELRVVAEARSYDIADVRVSAAPIRVAGDTTIYLVPAFAQPQDLAISDVIARMPGFKVESDGQVLYQGSPISHYYVEGMDLLGNRYALVNKNLPAGAVSAVEVLHGHQDKKILEGTQISDKTAVNVRLKKGVAVTGALSGALGFSPLLWEVRLTPMLFAKRQQIVAGLHANNTGDDILGDERTVYLTANGMEGLLSARPTLVSIGGSSPDIPGERYLRNNAQRATYNHLFKLAEGHDLTLNAVYARDEQREEQEKKTTYLLKEGDYVVDDRSEYTRNYSGMKVNLGYKANAKQFYLEDRLVYVQMWDKGEGTLSGSSAMQMEAKWPHGAVGNFFDMTIPVRRTKLFVASNIYAQRTPQQQMLLVEGAGGSTENSTQRVRNESLHADVEAKIDIPLWRLTLGQELSAAYKNTRYRTELEGYAKGSGDSLRNALSWNSLRCEWSTGLRYYYGKFQADLSLPLAFRVSDVRDAFHGADTLMRDFLFEPILILRYKPVTGLDLRAFTSIYASLDDESELARGYVRSGLRSVSRNEAVLGGNRGFSYSLSANYRHVLSGFFGSVRWSHSFGKYSPLSDLVAVTADELFYRTVDVEGKSESKRVTLNISWLIRALYTTIGAESYASRASASYLTEGLLGTSYTERLATTPSLRIAPSRFFSFDYFYTFNYTRFRSDDFRDVLMEQGHKASLHIYPHEGHILMAGYEWTGAWRDGARISNAGFLNASYTLNPPKHRFSYSVICRNLLNEKSFTEYWRGSASISETRFALRGREFLFRVRWTLGK